MKFQIWVNGKQVVLCSQAGMKLDCSAADAGKVQACVKPPLGRPLFYVDVCVEQVGDG